MNRQVLASFLFPLLPYFVASGVHAQNRTSSAGPFVCTPAAVPTIARTEGVSELVGDMLLNCTGGVPTPIGSAVPKSNIQLFLNVNITSMIVGPGAFSDALMLIDEPYPTPPSTATPTNIPPRPRAPA